MGVVEDVDIYTGNFSKAFGSQGGYVASTAAVKQLLVNAGRSYVYSTALPVPVVDASLAALRVAQTVRLNQQPGCCINAPWHHQEPIHKERLQRNMDLLGRGIGIAVASPIVPLVVGDTATTLAATRRLLQAGFHVPAIRPPTVPLGTSRLRLSLSAAHTEADIEGLVQALRASGVCFRGTLSARL